ncbi:hypothetical protein CIHG_00631 [Coccidioides immitis H538.4]|uniref:Uncharacterized protein n=3 Tax=Coccidioides immitis TaxID=5501 RepID=A0A0J8QHF5_COCIT|nr:hypothetical protein CIRG_07440 [Coccidioides immitis RMSCC 2394]KMU71784.1 hypothetical protein CISG_00094 [Coccidioides immitis RMSCC 3703]KMU82848.1 hypothetical protein CIHG_00631 [Coccidioides immitis H538.4]
MPKGASRQQSKSNAQSEPNAGWTLKLQITPPDGCWRVYYQRLGNLGIQKLKDGSDNTELASTKDIMIEHQLERLEVCVGNLLIKVIKRTFKGAASMHRLSQPAKWQRSK